MANYCTIDDVQLMLNVTFSNSITPAQVNVIIADVTNEIDFVLSSIGITSQPTDTKILARLKMICKYGVSGQIGFAKHGNAANTNDTQPDKYLKMYKDYLKEIRDNPELYTIAGGGNSAYISNQVLDGTETESENNAIYLDKDYKW